MTVEDQPAGGPTWLVIVSMFEVPATNNVDEVMMNYFYALIDVWFRRSVFEAW